LAKRVISRLGRVSFPRLATSHEPFLPELLLPNFASSFACAATACYSNFAF